MGVPDPSFKLIFLASVSLDLPALFVIQFNYGFHVGVIVEISNSMHLFSIVRLNHVILHPWVFGF